MPHGHRLLRKQRRRGLPQQKDGTFQEVELVGPPDIEHWQCSYGIFRTLVSFTDAMDQATVDDYANRRVVRYAKRYKDFLGSAGREGALGSPAPHLQQGVPRQAARPGHVATGPAPDGREPPMEILLQRLDQRLGLVVRGILRAGATPQSLGVGGGVRQLRGGAGRCLERQGCAGAGACAGAAPAAAAAA